MKLWNVLHTTRLRMFLFFFALVDVLSFSFTSSCLKIEHRKGTLRPGADADFVILDSSGYVKGTWVGGEEVWSFENTENWYGSILHWLTLPLVSLVIFASLTWFLTSVYDELLCLEFKTMLEKVCNMLFDVCNHKNLRRLWNYWSPSRWRTSRKWLFPVNIALDHGAMHEGLSV